MSRHKSSRLPNSFMSSYRIHESLVGELGDTAISPDMMSQFQRYCTCLMVVQFDIDVGPDLKIIRPSNVKFSEDDFRLICFSALPERISQDQPSEVTQDCISFHAFSFVRTTDNNHDNSHSLHGNVLYSQKRDASRLRGYLQEALVLLSYHRFPQLFHDCLWCIYRSNDFLSQSLDGKIPILDSAICNISQWPELEPNKQLELGILGQVLYFTVPPTASVPLLEPRFITSPVSRWNEYIRTKTSASNNSIDLYMLYENLVLSKHPVVVYGNHPKSVSLFIDLCVDMIRPLPFPEDNVFEYMTIHSSAESYCHGQQQLQTQLENVEGAERDDNDNDGTRQSSGKLNAGCIYGITNPLMLKSVLQETSTSSNIPYVIVLNMNSTMSNTDLDPKLSAYIRRCNRAIFKDRILAPSHKFHSRIYHMDSSVRDDTSQDVHFMIRFHFATLTSKLMAPLTSYFEPIKGSDALQFNYTQFYTDLSALQKLRVAGESVHSASAKNQLVPTGASQIFVEPSLAASLGSYFRTSISSSNLGFYLTANIAFYQMLIEGNIFRGWLDSNKVS